MRIRASALLAVAAMFCMVSVAVADLTPYNQDFEALLQPLPTSLANDGWLVYGNVFDTDLTFVYDYGAFPAPNNGAAFCQIVTGEGGVDQGAQQLVVFSDYENVDHGPPNSYLIEANVYQEQTIGAINVGEKWVFDFQAKLGNLEGSSTAKAFIKTLDPANGYALTNFIFLDTTALPITWAGYSLSIDIDAGLAGQILQIGFMNLAANYEGSGVFYDNIDFYLFDPSGVPAAATAVGVTLHQNYPNPFNPLTRIDFVLERQETVELAVYDIAGRRVATLHSGTLGEGDHHVTWNGKTDRGASAPAGHYMYMLETSAGRVSRSMVLLK